MVSTPIRLGPKRASKIRKLFNLTKEDDVCQYVIKRPLPLKDGKKQKFAAPKVQRLVTPVMLQVRQGSGALVPLWCKSGAGLVLLFVVRYLACCG